MSRTFCVPGLQADEVDVAIDMYKKARSYDHVIRLVSQHRRESLAQVWRASPGRLANCRLQIASLCTITWENGFSSHTFLGKPFAATSAWFPSRKKHVAAI